MPTIKSFKAILPRQLNVDKVVIGLENLSISSAKEIGKQNPQSFVHLLVPKIENYYLRGSKQEIAFQKIQENFEDFIQNRILVKDELPAIYIYRKTKNGTIKTGVWTVSNIDDYIENHIKKHELTRVEREKGLVEYLQQTGLDANPVLITYPNSKQLDILLEKETIETPALDFFLEEANHQVWRITNPLDINIIVSIFEKMPDTYIADGHHRAAAACSFGIKRRMLNLKHKGDEEYNFFSSVYISSNQLEILPFHRLLKLNHLYDHVEILEFIGANFNMIDISNNDLIPKEKHSIGFYYQHKSYRIDLRDKLSTNILHDLDVSLLQEFILKPLFNVVDPREDEKLYFLGGNINVEEVLKMIDNGKYDLAFFLYPVGVDDLMLIADMGETMPPKSTWFEPKFLAGLITHEID